MKRYMIFVAALAALAGCSITNAEYRGTPVDGTEECFVMEKKVDDRDGPDWEQIGLYCRTNADDPGGAE